MLLAYRWKTGSIGATFGIRKTGVGSVKIMSVESIPKFTVPAAKLWATISSDSKKQGGFKNQAQQLMFSSGFSEFHIEQELAVNRYR